jgi:hypothetical protein
VHGGVMGAEVDHHRLGARFELRHGRAGVDSRRGCGILWRIGTDGQRCGQILSGEVGAVE